MVKRAVPILHRNDPSKEPLIGHAKVTRQDWLNVARDILVSDGVAEVKVLAIGEQLEVSRSSFYWYFKSRKDLLSALLNEWEALNTSSIINHCEKPAASITEALCNFFRCFVDPDLFDQGLDFAVREWSRRDGSVRARIDRADNARLAAVEDMYRRFGYKDADTRARILYFMQLGYHALDQNESLEERMARVKGYLYGFTGVEPAKSECEALHAYALSKASRFP